MNETELMILEAAAAAQVAVDLAYQYGPEAMEEEEKREAMALDMMAGV